MPAGPYRHEVTIQEQSEAEDATGDVVDGTWTNLATDPTWFTSMKPGTGGESEDGLKMVARQATTFSGWARADIGPGMRFVLGSRTFNVTAVRSVDGEDRVTEVDCVETV